MLQFKLDYLDHIIQSINFADPLKEFCVNILGLDPQGVYGSDEDKAQLSPYKWGNFPDSPKNMCDKAMTNREVMVHWARIFRNANKDCFVNTLKTRVLAAETEYIIVHDVRYANEVDGIHELRGKVIRLTKNTHGESCDSESSLDNYKNFDAIIDNQNMSVDERDAEFFKLLASWNYL